MHRIAPFLFGLALVLLLGGPTVAAGTAAPHATVAVAAITWEPCASTQLPTQECAEFDVPLDYDEPDGATISLAVARVPATDQAKRIGSLFLNPGGPGNSGVLALPLQYAALPEVLQERFDVVGFDPRGIGESAPVRCFASIAEQIAGIAEMPRVPVGPDEETALQRATDEMAQKCGERNAETLAHLSTANVARDMDQLRQAVGDEALTYLGTSYGTYLGATYANLFPDRIRAMVLDGVINPPSYASFDHGDGDIVGPDTTSFLRVLSDQGSADALQAFFTECAVAGPDRCAFAAASAAETREKFDTLMDRLRTEPMIVQGPAGTLTVTYSIVVDMMWQTLYTAKAWPIMADGLQRLAEGDAAGFLAATGAIGGPPSPSYLNEPEGRPGSNCVDTDNPDDPARYLEMARSAAERSPYFGALWTYLALPCAFWPAADADRYTGPWDAETSAPILLISRVYDPATPHGGAEAAAETLGNARLLTIDGWGHGYYLAGRSTCADDSMAAYLIDLALPPLGIVCPEDVAPFSERLVVEAGQATPAAARPIAVGGDFSGLVVMRSSPWVPLRVCSPTFESAYAARRGMPMVELRRKIALIAAPYFLGQPGRGSGLGPQRLLDAGLDQVLASKGHSTQVTVIEPPPQAWDEIGASFGVMRATADGVRQAVDDGLLPIVLAGNCGTACLGSLGGFAPQEVGIVWLDAHGDFNTPETSPSGFFDGMPLAIAVGDCWQTLRDTIPGFHPVPTERVVLVGRRDIDAGEQERIDASAIAVVAPADVRAAGAAALAAPLAALRDRVTAVYLHVDLDVLDPSEGRANTWAAPGGLSLDEVKAVVREVGERFTIAGAALTSYDPTVDDDGRVADAGLQIAAEIAGAVSPR